MLWTAPRVVFGVPTFNGADHMAEAIESLLGQTREDLALVIVDDQSTDQTAAIAEGYSLHDARVSVHRNPKRLGMVRNWCRAFELAQVIHPGADLFAWASDHDAWHPLWLETLVAELDAHPQAVLAWPLYESIDAKDRSLNLPAKRFDSRHVAWPEGRLTEAVDRMSAGNMVYGLMRAEAVARCGVYREVLLPDRLLMAQLSLLGELRQVPEILWRRRFGGRSASLRRQRDSFFPGRRAPVYMHLPWWLMHGAPFALSLARGDLAPEVGRTSTLRLTRKYIACSYLFERRRQEAHKVRARAVADKKRVREERLRKKEERLRKKERKRRLARKRNAINKMRKRAIALPALKLGSVRARLRDRPGTGGQVTREPEAAPASVSLSDSAQIVDAFHRLYYESAGRTWKDTRWLGVRTEKVPLDLWIYQEILCEQRPDVIVETGTAMGGSALFMANVCELIGNGVVVTIDVRADDGRPQHSRIRYVSGSSTDPEVVADVEALLPRSGKALVVLDSDHSHDHVLDELRIYQDFVPVGGYMVVEDSNVHGNPVLHQHGPGPMEAIDAFLRETDRFEIDPDREKFFLTFSPRGYLRRLR
jgi:cephalosporin hydroxylase/glycosyltransferase involved in cell wall biosynthesis